MACDNEQALQIFDPEFLPDPQQANFDLANALFHLLRSSCITWTCKHVRGHQDSRKRHKPLSPLERLNVKMDALAEFTRLYYSQVDNPLCYSTSVPFDGEGWQLWQGSTKITDPLTATLYSIMQDASTQMWWKRHGHLSSAACDNIDWDGTQDLMKSLTPPERRFITKHASSNCGVGTTLVQWKLQEDAACPWCGQPEDSTMSTYAMVKVLLPRGTQIFCN